MYTYIRTRPLAKFALGVDTEEAHLYKYVYTYTYRHTYICTQDTCMHIYTYLYTHTGRVRARCWRQNWAIILVAEGQVCMRAWHDVRSSVTWLNHLYGTTCSCVRWDPFVYCLTERQRETMCVVQGTATHCNKLHHTATHCNTLQHTAPHCNTLQCHVYKWGVSHTTMFLVTHMK